MMKNLKIRHKILLYPILFTLVILVVFFIFKKSNSDSKSQLNNIQSGYVPYLEIATKLSFELINMQREFQDAVAAADVEMLGASKEKYQYIKVLLDSAANNIVGRNNTRLPDLIIQFDSYYGLASETSNSMIRGEYTEALSSNISKMIEEFNLIKTNLNSLIIESKQESSSAFSSTIITFNKSFQHIIIILIVSLIIFLIISYLISTRLNRSIRIIRDRLVALAEGKVNASKNANLKLNNDEMGEMAESVFSVEEGLEKTSAFAEQIGKGNLNANFEPLSTDDKLGNALLEMKDNLDKARTDEEKMKKEEEKNKWTSNGLAKFGDIIRVNEDGIEKLAFNIVKNLIDFLDISMGALYVADEENDEIIYKIKSAIAYDRERIIDSEFKVGEGLVGRCVFEKLSIYLTDLPRNYIKVTSGLGTANPNCLLLVPLISDDKVFGVLELASFHEFEPYKIAFVEKLADSIASTLLTVQNNDQTKKLLEQSKMQGEELAAQEEEMRQNMEELQATQEEAARREEEMVSVIDAIDNSVFKVEYDATGNIISVNNIYSAFLKTSADSLLNTHYKDEYDLMAANMSELNSLWPAILSGTSKKIKTKIYIKDTEFTLEEHYTPIVLKDDNKPSKIIKFSYLLD